MGEPFLDDDDAAEWVRSGLREDVLALLAEHGPLDRQGLSDALAKQFIDGLERTGAVDSVLAELANDLEITKDGDRWRRLASLENHVLTGL